MVANNIVIIFKSDFRNRHAAGLVKSTNNEKMAERGGNTLSMGGDGGFRELHSALTHIRTWKAVSPAVYTHKSFIKNPPKLENRNGRKSDGTGCLPKYDKQ